MVSILDKIQKKYDSLKEKEADKRTIISISNYLKERGVRMLYVCLPYRKRIKGLTDFENERLNGWAFDFNNAGREIQMLKRIYGESITLDYIESIFDGGVVVQGDKRKLLLDFQSDNQHIINGRRITIGNPEKYHNTIYTHGACTWRGVGVEDSQTIASYLQELINDSYSSSYRIINSAIGRGSNLLDDFEYIKEQQYQPGDIVVIGSHGVSQSISSDFYAKHNIEYFDTSYLFNRPHEIGEWFLDSVLHTNYRGNKVIAKSIFQKLQALNWLTKSTPQYGVGLQKDKEKPEKEELTHGRKIYGDNPDLLKYIHHIEAFKKGGSNSKNGSIVMNCNPFTLGHRYLIEYAASKVDFLYIFVVEENKSFFPFEDRLELVKKGTADIPNVVVLPSGNFIISAVTFPGYFYKDDLKETKIDCSNDLSVFAQYIAPALNIKVRFAGEEPLDPVTKQYNEGMYEILPQYGMQFCEIPRKQDDEGVGVISASRVRKLLKEGDYDGLKKLVPQTTFDYLVKRYKK